MWVRIPGSTHTPAKGGSVKQAMKLTAAGAGTSPKGHRKAAKERPIPDDFLIAQKKRP